MPKPQTKTTTHGPTTTQPPSIPKPNPPNGSPGTGTRFSLLQVLAFFALAYLIAWFVYFTGGLFPHDSLTAACLSRVTKFGPTLAAIVVVLVLADTSSRRRFFGACFHWRVALRWYVVALLGPFLLWCLPLAIHFATADVPIEPKWPRLAEAPNELVKRTVLGGGLGEEPGWRGLAVPGLEARVAPLPAALTIGAVWGLWHAPALFLPDPTSPERDAAKSGQWSGLVLFTLLTSALSVLFTVLYHRTDGSVLLCILAHGAFNSTENIVKAVLPSVDADDSVTILYGLSILAVAIVLAIATRGRLGRKSPTIILAN